MYVDYQTEVHFADKENVSIEAARCAGSSMFQLVVRCTSGHGKSRRGHRNGNEKKSPELFCASRATDGHLLCSPDNFRDKYLRNELRRKKYMHFFFYPVQERLYS